MKHNATITGFILAAFIAGQCLTSAAEINFHAAVVAPRGIVRLGDVAEIRAASAEEARFLAGIALVTAPSEDQPRVLKRQEAQQLLQLSGVNLREHRFGGAELTQISAPYATTAARPAIVSEVSKAIQIQPTSGSRHDARRPIISSGTVEARVGQAIMSHLVRMAEHPADWQVDVAVSPRVAQVLDGKNIFRVEGGISPWLGRQQFFIFAGDEAAPQRLPVEAEISGTTRAATVIRPIERGAVLSADDVEMQTVSLKNGVKLVFDANQVIGREAARTLNAGQVVGADMLREIRLVRRGDDIQVVSVGAGIQISEPAKALADGGQGDTITVEFGDRRKMTARVTGLRRAEVYAMQTVRSQARSTPLPLDAQASKR
jgi:flagella basal body P-ring formation protein FlgA